MQDYTQNDDDDDGDGDNRNLIILLRILIIILIITIIIMIKMTLRITYIIIGMGWCYFYNHTKILKVIIATSKHSVTPGDSKKQLLSVATLTCPSPRNYQAQPSKKLHGNTLGTSAQPYSTPTQ